MRAKKPELEERIGSLLTRTLSAEATELVENLLERAFAALDDNSRRLLEAHFSGRTAEELAKENGLPVESMRECIAQAKRSLLREVRQLRATRQ